MPGTREWQRGVRPRRDSAGALQGRGAADTCFFHSLLFRLHICGRRGSFLRIRTVCHSLLGHWRPDACLGTWPGPSRCFLTGKGIMMTGLQDPDVCFEQESRGALADRKGSQGQRGPPGNECEPRGHMSWPHASAQQPCTRPWTFMVLSTLLADVWGGQGHHS